MDDDLVEDLMVAMQEAFKSNDVRSACDIYYCNLVGNKKALDIISDYVKRTCRSPASIVRCERPTSRSKVDALEFAECVAGAFAGLEDRVYEYMLVLEVISDNTNKSYSASNRVANSSRDKKHSQMSVDMQYKY